VSLPLGEWGRTAALVVLLLLLLAGAFFYGSTQTWASEWLRFGALLVVAIGAWTAAPAELLERPVGKLLLPLVIFLVWGAIQALPIPRGVLGVVSPKAAEIYRQAAPEGGGEALPQWLLERALQSGLQVGEDRSLPEATPDPGDRASGRAISLHPGDTRDALLSWLTPLLFFVAAAWVAREPAQRYHLLWGVTALTGLWGFVSILQRLGWDGAPFWDHDWSLASAQRPVLPFVNRNHYAGFVTMGLLASVGLFLAILTRSTGTLNRRALREAIADGAWATPRLIAAGLAIALGFTGIVLSGSRGGMLALAGGLVFAVLARTLRTWLIPGVAIIVLAGLLAGVPSMLSSGSGEFQQAPFVSGGESSGLLRMDAWTKTSKLFLDFPLTGSGLGTFRWAFSMYQRQGEWMIFREAHNDYLQVLAETGLVGVAILGWALFAYLWWILRPALGTAARRPRYTTIGAAAAVVALLLHSIFDFNLQIPSNAALFAVLLGVVTAAAGDDEPAGGSAR